MFEATYTYIDVYIHTYCILGTNKNVQRQNVLRHNVKRKHSKTKRPRYKTSQIQNDQTTKRLKPKKAPDKVQNIPLVLVNNNNTIH